MIDESPRPRFGGAKVRTGCIVCKTRHVKCDEVKPECLRCQKRNLKCEYSTPNPVRKAQGETFVIYDYETSSQVTCRRVSTLPEMSSLEQRSLKYFQLWTARELGGSFSSETWSRNMMQVSQHEIAVRHAVVAIGALHEQLIASRGPHANTSDFAMQQYGKAINHVLKLKFANSQTAADVALITCVLFAAFESLQGHYKSALTHVTSGIKVLEEQDTQKRDGYGSYISKEALRTLFMRYDSQSLEIGDDNFRPGSQLFEASHLPFIPPSFNSLHNAMMAFDILYNRNSHFLLRVNSPNNHGHNGGDIMALIQEHADLVNCLERWGRAFDSSNFNRSSPGGLILQINRILMSTAFRVDLSLGEMTWDNHTEDFEMISLLADQYLKQVSMKSSNLYNDTMELQSGTAFAASEISRTATLDSVYLTTGLITPVIRPTFTLVIGLIPALYMTSTRCRDPLIRRRALHVLSTCNRKEGIWDSSLSAKVAKRQILIEEGSASLDGGVVTTAAQIPEHARIRTISSKFGNGKYGWIEYQRSTFGLDAPPITVKEAVSW